jgi:hypothetical protein
MEKQLDIGDTVEYREIFHARTWPLSQTMYDYLAGLAQRRAECELGVSLSSPTYTHYRISERRIAVHYKSQVIGLGGRPVESLPEPAANLSRETET